MSATLVLVPRVTKTSGAAAAGVFRDGVPLYQRNTESRKVTSR
jgi:hypothetical protein